MKKTISKNEAKDKIEDFFENIDQKNSKQVYKIKKLSASYKIPLGNLKKKFCKKCLNPFDLKERVRIKKGFRLIECQKCGYKSRIKIS